MKTTPVVVLALVCASTLGQPIVLLKNKDLNTRDIAPTEVTDLQARKINWSKVGGFFKKAAGFAARLLFRRNEDGDLDLVARDLIDDNGELVAREFYDDFLEARDFDDNYLEARDFHEDHPHISLIGHHAYDIFSGGSANQFPKRGDNLEVRDFDEDLEARDFHDDHPHISLIGHHAYNFINAGSANQYRKRGDDLEVRDFDEDLEVRGFHDDHPLISTIGHHAYEIISNSGSANQYRKRGDQYDGLNSLD